MQWQDFISRVQQRANIRTPDEALDLIRTTFEVLSERLQDEDASTALDPLAGMLRDYLDLGHGEPLDVEAFVQRIAEQEGISAQQAREQARAVLKVACELAGQDEDEGVLQLLTLEYQELFGRPGRGH